MEPDVQVDFPPLHSELNTRLKLISQSVERFWAHNHYYDHFTRHGPNHSARVEGNLLRLAKELPRGRQLTEGEWYISRATCQLYDIGMQSRWTGPVLGSDYNSDRYSGQEVFVPTHAQLSIIRAQKHILTQELIYRSINLSPSNSYLRLGLTWADDPCLTLITDICGWISNVALDQVPEEDAVAGKIIRVKLLVALLRLADQLYIDSNRIYPQLVVSADLPLHEKLRWLSYQYVTSLPIDRGKIRFKYALPYHQQELLPKIRCLFETNFTLETNPEIRYLLEQEDLKCVLVKEPVILKLDATGALAPPLDSDCFREYKNLDEFAEPSGGGPGKPGRPYQVDFAIITALELEANAVLNRLSTVEVVRRESEDIYTYYTAKLPTTNRGDTFRLVVIQLPRVGSVSAANGVTSLIHLWNPRFLIMVGIAGGIPQDNLNLGDVVIADQVVTYEYAKTTPDGMQPRDRVYPASALLLDRVYNFRSEDWRNFISVRRPGTAKFEKPERRIGLVACGNKVVASQDFRDAMVKRWPKLMAVEMEAEGLYAAAFERPQIIGTLVIRGICDMADEKKSDEWQEYAADTAAAYMYAFLRSGPVNPGASSPD